MTGFWKLGAFQQLSRHHDEQLAGPATDCSDRGGKPDSCVADRRGGNRRPIPTHRFAMPIQSGHKTKSPKTKTNPEAGTVKGRKAMRTLRTHEPALHSKDPRI